MNTLTVDLPDSVDPAYALWTLAHSLYEKGDLTLDQAASLAELAPTYFKRRLEDVKRGHFNAMKDKPLFDRGTHLLSKPFDRKRFDDLIEQLDIQESYEELSAMLTK